MTHKPAIMNVQQLKAHMSNGNKVLLLDVREHHELEVCRIEGSVHIPMGEIAERLEELPRDVPIVCQCHHGGRSAQVQDFLLEQGYTDVYNLEGGIHAWAAEIDPDMQCY